MSKKKEKSTPGPSHYKEDKQWKRHSSVSRLIGNYSLHEKRHSMFQQKALETFNYPSPIKYKNIKEDVYMPRAPKAKIAKDNFPRFKPTKRTLAPSPSSYQFEKSKDQTMVRNAKFSIGKGPRETYFAKEAKDSSRRSPGVGKY